MLIRRRAMWAKLSVLAVAAVAVILLLYAPLMSATITVELPPGATSAAGRQDPPPAPDAGRISQIIGLVAVAAVAVGAGVLARRIVRRHTIKDDTFD